MVQIPLPTTIITGFLGSGKTTLLNHILTHQNEVKFALLINEFGKVGIDKDLIVSEHNDIIQLQNGCICCTINGDLVQAVGSILDSKYEIDHLLVETTGIADPFPIIMTFVGKDLSPYIRLDAVISLIDAENFNDELLNDPAAYNQIKYGDIVLINKCDLVDVSILQEIKNKVLDINPRSNILETNYSKAPLALLMGVGKFDHQNNLTNSPASNHSEKYEVFSAETDQAIDLQNLQSFFRQNLTNNIYRGKGILWIAGKEDRFVFHLTGKRFTLQPEEWGFRKKYTNLVLIGQDLDKEKLNQGFLSCIKFQNNLSN